MDTAARRQFFAVDNHFYQIGVVDPSVVATDGLPGTIYIQVPVYPATVPAPVYWSKNDNGETVNWSHLITGGGGGGTYERVDYTLTLLNISNGYVDLPHLITANQHNSIIANMDGAALLEEGVGRDYTVSNGLVTRITFDATLIPYLVAGDFFQVQYVR